VTPSDGGNRGRGPAPESRRVGEVGHIDDLADRYVDEWAALNPTGATFVGIAGYDDKTDDL
jgi:hypothetical protein